jgi:antitoxin HicB
MYYIMYYMSILLGLASAIAYPAHIWREDNTTWSVEFPDLPGCFSSGSSLLEARKKAEEALDSYLESLDSRSVDIPEPLLRTGEDVHMISPSLKVGFAITLKQERNKQGLTQKEVAERMGVKWSAYQRIENPRKTNPTLSTIAKLQEVFGRPFLAL